nr:zinc finger protein 513-like [Penaeus vannamei]
MSPYPRLHACPRCSYTTSVTTNMKNHMLTHTDEKPYACDQCSYRSKQKGNLKRHIMTNHGATSQSLESSKVDRGPCLPATTTNSWMMPVGPPGTGRPPRVLQCSYCSYNTVFRTNYLNHVRKHTGEKPFKCPHCNYCSTQRSNLTRHMLRCPAKPRSPRFLIVGVGLFGFMAIGKISTFMNLCICALICTCLRSIIQAVAFAGIAGVLRHDHLVTLADTWQPRLDANVGKGPRRQHECSYCPYIARDKTDLRKHSYTHTGEKPYACPYCPYRARQNSCIRTHMRRHHSFSMI